MEALQDENKHLLESSEMRTKPIKTTKIIKEIISTDPDSSEIVTERESTTIVEEVEDNWYFTKARSLIERLNPFKREGTIISRVFKAIIVSLLMMGTMYAVWKGLKGIGIVRGSWMTKVENLTWGIYSRIPFLPYAVGSVKGFFAGLFSGRPQPTIREAEELLYNKKEL